MNEKPPSEATLEALAGGAGPRPTPDFEGFRPRERLQVYECRCKGQLWYLLENGRAECRACGAVSKKIRITRGAP